MKDLIVYTPKTELPIPDNLYTTLSQKLGSCNSEILPWITISLVHSSYMNEHSKKFGPNRNILNILDSLGATFVDLILYDIAHADQNLTKMIEYATFVTNNKAQLTESIFEEFKLEKMVLIGKGEKENLASRLKFVIARQFCGALVICYGYDVVKLVFYQLTRKINLVTEYKDFKTLLQEYSQFKKMGTPKYDLIKEYGLEHQKKFLIKVSTADGKSAQAEGGSKKEGQKNSALEYIRRFAPTLLENKTKRVKTNVGGSGSFLVPLHKNFVESICKLFNLSLEKSWALSQSLTHVSFVNETIYPEVVDNRKHAQLGAKVLESLLTQQIATLALESLSIDEVTIEQYRSLLSGEDFSSEGFDLLNLQDGVLLSVGQKKLYNKVVSTRAEFFQAVIGATFKMHGSWDGFVRNMPEILENWFVSKLQSLQKIEEIGDVAPILRLQPLLQAIRLNAEYKFNVSGLDHERKFTPHLLLSSEITLESFTIKSEKKFPSRKLASRHVAYLVLKLINIVNSEFGINIKGSYEDHKELNRLARFLIYHELSACRGAYDINRWRRFGVLGSQLLAQGKMYEFKLWAIAAGNIVQNKNIPTNVLSLYSSIPQVSENDQIEYKESILSIGSFVENLSPEVESADIRFSDEFDKIVKLSKVYKLLSQKWGVIKLRQIVDDLLLLLLHNNRLHNRLPKLIFEPNIPDIQLSEREGIYLELVLSLLDLLVKIKPEFGNSTLSIAFDFESQNSVLTIMIKFVEPFLLSEKILSYFNTDILWKFLYREASISDIHADTSLICITTRILSPDNTFASQALDAYKMQNLLAKTENQISSQLLHDLKNQLLAYQSSLDTVGADRESFHRSRFDAYHHLANAKAICYSLDTVSNSMASPTIEPVDIGEFIRYYIAEKLTSFPSNIRLETPKTIGSSIVYTSRSFLKSIFENLTKNAVEAMPGGGEIRVDWLYDEISELLLIDISDTGPGLSPELIDRITSGKIIDSSKHKGSGIGILSVQSMVDRLGGKCTVSTSLGKGTQWNITLPSMSPKETVDVNDSDELLGNLGDDKMEL